MTTPIPPLLPEEQVRRVENNLRRCRSRRRWLWLFLILSLGANFIFYGLLHFSSRAKRAAQHGSTFVERTLGGNEDSDFKIAVIHVEGVISAQTEGHVGFDGMVGDIKEQLRLANEDSRVKAIILRVDSPGGEVLASDAIYRAVRDARDGPKKKPLVCSMGSLAASGGFYAAMGAKWIVADNLTITGSIGVIMQTLNYKGLFEKVGLRSYVFKSGKFKDIMSGSREPTQEEMDLVQNLIGETYNQFLGVVAKERHLDAETLRNTIADGRILSGRQAMEAKLVDQLGTFDDAVKKAEEMASIPDSKLFDYVVPFSLSNLLGMFAESKAPGIKVELGTGSPAFGMQQGKMYFLSQHLF